MESIQLLIPLDKYRMDVGGNIYPLSNFVEAKEFSYNLNIREGLLGIIEGECDEYFLNWLQADVWLVVRTEKDNNLIPIYYNNMAKFKFGLIMFEGNKKQALDYIRKNKNENSMY